LPIIAMTANAGRRSRKVPQAGMNDHIGAIDPTNSLAFFCWAERDNVNCEITPGPMRRKLLALTRAWD
jgi:hypothetical protein